MGQDNQPKHRQEARDLKRRAALRAPYKRVLIVCEGEKTEPYYFGEIRQEHRLSTANLQVWPSAFGTQPLQVVDYAESLFRRGDRCKSILPKSFDHICAVFDRDDHATYHNALAKADALNGRLQNDAGERVVFQAIPSVPCFELWLLIHFEDIHAQIGRDDVYARLRRHLPTYDKGQRGYWAVTKGQLEQAVSRAEARASVTTAYDGNEPYTDVHKLIRLLTRLKA